MNAARNLSLVSSHRLRVLIADDERDEVATLAALLMDEGHQVREVYRGDTVLEQVRDFSPHVVLLDIGMPGMNGYVIAKRLHEEYGERCPVLIAVTAWNKGTHRMYGKIAGFNKYITKPYDPAALLALLPLLTR
ncbi:MAG: response regulator [Betaproteobacteria bacterium]|nr:response regulator [Betaproteobacteria bacterium]